jgi:hypothetical protein
LSTMHVEFAVNNTLLDVLAESARSTRIYLQVSMLSSMVILECQER